MDWMKIGTAILLIMMLVYLIPRAKIMMQQTRKAEPGEWMGVVLPLAAVAGFVALLVMII